MAATVAVERSRMLAATLFLVVFFTLFFIVLVLSDARRIS